MIWHISDVILRDENMEISSKFYSNKLVVFLEIAHHVNISLNTKDKWCSKLNN